jgi:antitoxin component YwqK of YwqJK toxin-antitoxin module
MKDELAIAYKLLDRGHSNKFEDESNSEDTVEKTSFMEVGSFLGNITGHLKEVKSLPKLIAFLIIGVSFSFLFSNIKENRNRTDYDGSVASVHIEKRANGLFYELNPLRVFTGENTILWSDGKKKEQTNYMDGKLHGLSRTWSSYGQIEKEEHYQMGKKEGLATLWYKNGNTKEETNYHQGIQVGLTNKWYENGNIESEINYKNGKKHGLVTLWYKNKQKEFEGHYEDGVQDGVSSSWFDSGYPETKINYKNGKKHGLSTLWHKNGNYKNKSNYKYDRRDGKETIWREDGSLQLEREHAPGYSKTVYH